MEKKFFLILSIDGGGIRGVFPAHILKCIEERLKVNVFESFDMFAGTSTGSIIAAGLACKKSPSCMVNLYKEYGHQIFSAKVTSLLPNWLKQAFHSKYSNKPLKDVLEAEFGDIVLGEVEKPLMIPATDIGNGGVHVFKSKYSPYFTRDASVPIKNAVLASCSAPTFFDPTFVDAYLLADGGVWANNPSLASVIEAKHRLGVDVENIRIISIGTGYSRTEYGTGQKKNGD